MHTVKLTDSELDCITAGLESMLMDETEMEELTGYSGEFVTKLLDKLRACKL